MSKRPPSLLTMNRERVDGSRYQGYVTETGTGYWGAIPQRGPGRGWSLHFRDSQWPVEGEVPALGQMVWLEYRASRSGAMWEVTGLVDPIDYPQGESCCLSCGDPTTECTCRDTCDGCNGDKGWYLGDGYEYHSMRRGPYALEWEPCGRCGGEGEVLRFPREVDQ